MKAKLQELVEALNSSVLTDTEKNEWFHRAENMPDGLVDVLIRALKAKSKEELKIVRADVHKKRKELHEYTEQFITEGINNLYKQAEQFSGDNDEQRAEDLLNTADEEKTEETKTE